MVNIVLMKSRRNKDVFCVDIYYNRKRMRKHFRRKVDAERHADIIRQAIKNHIDSGLDVIKGIL